MEREKVTQATRVLAEFTASLTFDGLPSDVVEKTKLCILDSFGCCLFGSTLPAWKKLSTMATSECAPGASTLIGSSTTTSASGAALVNGASAHSFQLDEVHNRATLHPGSVAIPVAWALAETNDALHEKRIVTAIVAGYEVGIRVALAAEGRMFTRGWHNQGTSGVFSAAATAASMLGLDADRAQHALGLAGSQAAGLMAVQEGAMAKGFHSGRAAQSGVYAALLAQLGYTGIPDVLEAPYGGFLSTLVGEYSVPQLTENLRERWEIIDVGFKPYACANVSTTAIDALDALMREHRLSADDLAEVTAYVSTNSLHHCGWPYDPEKAQGVLAAQMNLRFGLAVIAVERAVRVEHFTAERMREPKLLAFIERVKVEADERFDRDPALRVACRIVVKTRSGASFEAERLYRRGSEKAPMSREELTAKFVDLASETMATQRAEELAERVLRFDASDLPAIRKLLRVS